MWSIIFYKSLAEKINGLYTVFAVDSEARVIKGNKTAGARAREDSLALEKELKNFRHISLDATK